ncbi:Low conductance mechanosensitive channel YnaI [compost metagenome]
MEKFFTTESAWFNEDLVAFFRHAGFLMPNWKWLMIGAGLAIGIIMRPILQLFFREVKKHFRYAKTHPQSFWAYFLHQKTERPVAWLITVLFWLFIADVVEIPGALNTYYIHFLKGLLALSIINLAYFAVDALGMVMMNTASKTSSTFDDQLANFTKKALKFFVVIIGTLIVLQSFGLNVVSLLAGLGLGGLALALAAQDTAANVFGSITILFDQPFQVGDWVKVGSNEGTVEEIGFRSTRIRTFYNSVITVPNSMMAKEVIDNMGVRPARRIRQVLGLTYETPPQKIVEFCDHVKYVIRQHEKVRPSTIIVAFNGYADSALNVLVNFHIEVATGDEELALQQEIFLEILKVAAEMKVDFAYPTQRVYQTILP